MIALLIVSLSIAAGLLLSGLLYTKALTSTCNGCGLRKFTTGGLCIDCILNLDHEATSKITSSRCIRCGRYIPDVGSFFCAPCKEEKISGHTPPL